MPCANRIYLYDERMKRLALKSVVVSLVLVGAACSGDGSDETSTTATTTTVAPVTSLAASGSTEAVPTTEVAPSSSVTTSSTAPGDPVTFPEYTIVSREPGDDGDTVVVLLDKDSYGSLTDIDLANVLADVVDKFPPILTAYVIDDDSAAEVVLLASPTEADLELLSNHYLVRLEEGFRMVFAGPFEDTPVAILGS